MVRRLHVALVAGIALLAVPAAGQEPLDPMRVDPSLRGLSFGVNKEQVVAWLKARVSGEYEARIRATSDVRERDDLAREAERRLAAVGTVWASFDGTRSGWDASVIKDEFAHGTLEELLHEREGDTNLYFFFAKGVFYKLVRTTTAQPSQVIAEFERAYGKPTAVVPEERKPGETIRQASWSTGLLRVVVEDRWTPYMCAIQRWSLAATEDAVKVERERVGKRDQGMSPLIDQAKRGSSPDEVDPVDAMIGARPETPPEPAKPLKKPRKKPAK